MKRRDARPPAGSAGSGPEGEKRLTTPGEAAPPAGGARAAILAATVQLLRERGLTATRTRDVTALAGLSTGLLNHYFTWNALRAAALDQVMAQGLATLWPSDAEPDPRQVMEALAESAFSETLDPLWRLWVEAVDAASTDPAIADVLLHTNNTFVARIAGCLTQGAAQGQWRCPDPDGAAFRLMALHDGLVGMLLTGLPGLTRATAIAHWRTAFRLECPKVG